MQNFRARRGKIGKTNVNIKFLTFYFLNLTFVNLTLGLGSSGRVACSWPPPCGEREQHLGDLGPKNGIKKQKQREIRSHGRSR